MFRHYALSSYALTCALLRLKMLTSGAAPPAKVLASMQALGVHVDHVYGFTEALGVNAARPAGREQEHDYEATLSSHLLIKLDIIIIIIVIIIDNNSHYYCYYY